MIFDKYEGKKLKGWSNNIHTGSVPHIQSVVHQKWVQIFGGHVDITEKNVLWVVLIYSLPEEISRKSKEMSSPMQEFRRYPIKTLALMKEYEVLWSLKDYLSRINRSTTEERQNIWMSSITEVIRRIRNTKMTSYIRKLLLYCHFSSHFSYNHYPQYVEEWEV